MVAGLEDFIGANFDVDTSGTEFRIYLHVTARVDLGKRGVCFPLKPAYERANQTRSGREDAWGIHQAGGLGTVFDEFRAQKKCMFSRADAKVIDNAEEEFTDSPRATHRSPSDLQVAGDSGASSSYVDPQPVLPPPLDPLPTAKKEEY